MFDKIIENFKNKINGSKIFVEHINRLSEYKDNYFSTKKSEKNCDDYVHNTMFPRVYAKIPDIDLWPPIDLAPMEIPSENLDNVLDKFVRAVKISDSSQTKTSRFYRVRSNFYLNRPIYRILVVYLNYIYFQLIFNSLFYFIFILFISRNEMIVKKLEDVLQWEPKMIT